MWWTNHKWQNDALSSPLLDPLEGQTMLSCGKLGLGGCSQLPALKGVEGHARSPEIRLGRGTRLSHLSLHPKPTTRGLVHIREHLWVLGQATGTLTHFTHHGPNSGEATTFPHIVYSAALRGGYIQMALFLGTPKEESRNCPRLKSRDFGNSYLSTVKSDWSEVWTKVVALKESFPTPCHTPWADVRKKSIPDF